MRLHQALADLDSALVALPDAISRAIRSELEVEEHELRAALDDFSGTSSEDNPELERHWEFDHPFVKDDDGTDTLDDPSCRLFAEPYGSDGFYLTVQAPEPGDDDASWEIEIGRWEPDDPGEEHGDHTSATGSPVIDCALPVAPSADEIAYLLKSVGNKPLLLAEWAETPVGTVLAGTTRVVTKRYDS